VTVWPSNTKESRRLADRASKVMTDGNTRSLTWFEPYPPYVARGRGAHVFDVDGHKYLDLTNNLGVLIHGHAHGPTVTAVKAQVENGSCFALPTASEVDLAELLCERVESFERVRFMNTGSEAVALALRCARAFTGKSKIAKLEGVYHGSNDFAEIGTYSSPENWGNTAQPTAHLPGTPKELLESIIMLEANNIEQTAAALAAHADELAAVIIDPVPGRCGMQPLTPAYVDRLREVTRSLGILLIYDEVIAFRFGFSGAQGRFGGDPDITVLGKIIGGGFPIGAIAGRASVIDAAARLVGSSGTFTANPVSMVAGLATMHSLDEPAFSALDVLGDRTRAEMNAIAVRAGVTCQAVGTGSITSIYFHNRPLENYRDYYKDARQLSLTTRLHRRLLERGIVVATSGTLFLSTAMGSAEEDELLSGFEAALGSGFH
jgi:glutamate-1-semialdehyde 2,1-aminomutase